MGVSLTKESKSNISLSLESKDDDLTWDEATMTWDETDATWERPGSPLLTKESKSAVSLSLESK